MAYNGRHKTLMAKLIKRTEIPISLNIFWEKTNTNSIICVMG
jgi:hypothetical protein